MLSLLIPQLLSFGGGLPDDLSLTNLVSDALPVALIGTITWLIMQNRDRIYYWVVDRLTITAQSESGNEAYAWMQTWAAAQPGWSNFRTVQVASAGGRNDVFAWLQRYMQFETVKPYWCRPTSGTWMLCRFKGVYVMITFYDPTNNGSYTPSVMEVKILTLDRDWLDRLLMEARTLYKQSREGLQVWTHPRALGGPEIEWENWCMMDRRSIDSLVLDDEIKTRSLEDVREFLSEESKQWYKENSLPYRRGYLFYGVPGSGKTTLIHCIANELDRDVCVVTLSAVDDVTLPKLLGSTPERAVVIIEDIDVAIRNSGTANESRSNASQRNGPYYAPSHNGLTLSGLLNAIDGVTSQNGRILFVTTNKEAVLDPALTRAGRLDVHIEFHNAKSEHAARLFQRFYRVKSKSKASASLSTEEIDELAKRFADAIPDGVLAMAQIQNYLMSYKHEPHAACDAVHEWIAGEQLKGEQRRTHLDNAADAPIDIVVSCPPHGDEPSSPHSDAGSAPTLACSPSADHKALFETVRELTQVVSILATGTSPNASASIQELAVTDVGQGLNTTDSFTGASDAQSDMLALDAAQDGADLGLALRSL